MDGNGRKHKQWIRCKSWLLNRRAVLRSSKDARNQLLGDTMTSFWGHVPAGRVKSHLIHSDAKPYRQIIVRTLSTPRTRLGYPFDWCTKPDMYFELFRRTQVLDRLGCQHGLLRIGNIDLFSALSHDKFKKRATIITFPINLGAVCQESRCCHNT